MGQKLSFKLLFISNQTVVDFTDLYFTR